MALNSSKNQNIMASFLNKKTIEGSGAAPKEFPIKMIDIHDIVPNENNCYAITNPEGLAFEMELNGNHVDPLEVIDNHDGTYRLVAGHRRRAAVLLRLERGDDIPTTVPCMVKEYQDDDLLSAQDREIIALIASNSQREKTVFEKLNEIVAIEPLARKIYDNKLADKKISGSFRKFFSDNFLAISSSALQRLQSLSKLIPEGREAVEKGELSETAAAVLASLDEDLQVEYLLLLDDGEIENTVAAIKNFKDSHIQKKEEPVLEKPAKVTTVDPVVPAENSEDVPVDASVTEESIPAVEETVHVDDEQQTEAEISEEETTEKSKPVPNVNINALLDDEAQKDAENEALNWILDGLRAQIPFCDEYIKTAQENGNTADEAIWYQRKAKLLTVISTFE